MSASKIRKVERCSHALKDAMIAGIVAFSLFVLLLGFLTDDSRGPLVLLHAPGLLARVGIVFVGRFMISLLYYNAARFATSSPRFGRRQTFAQRFKWPLVRDVPVAASVYVPERLATILTPVVPLHWAGTSVFAHCIFFPVLSYDNPYYLGIAIITLTYVMLGWGLNIVVGLAGLLDLGYVAFYAVGAYSYAIIAQTYDWSFWVCLPLAGLFAAFFGVLLGFPVLRLRGDYLAIVTLAFGEIVRIVLLNWVSLTNGPNGIGTIPRASFFRHSVQHRRQRLCRELRARIRPDAPHRVSVLRDPRACADHELGTIRLRQLPVGRAWEALREDEIACRSLGINTTNTKLTAFAIGAMFGGFAGAFFATRQGFISPDSFTFPEFGVDPCHRRAWRHGFATRRGDCRNRDDSEFRTVPRIRTIPPGDFRLCHGRHHGLAPARSRFKPRADGISQRAKDDQR